MIEILPSYLSQVVTDGHARGWSFVPLNGKIPNEKGWQKRERESLEQALEWAAAGNVGVRTGPASGELIVLDVDAAKGGTLEGLPVLPATVTVETGGGGFHYYFKNSSGERIGNRAGKFREHVDCRGDGGQVVAAGAIHPDTGAAYQYAEGFAPWEVEVAEIPGWLRRAINPLKPPPMSAPSTPRPPSSKPAVDRYAQSVFSKEIKAVVDAKEGVRNVCLNKAAFSLGQFVGAGRLERAEVEDALLRATSLPEREARATIQSGVSAGIANPREPEAPKTSRRPAAPPGEVRPSGPPPSGPATSGPPTSGPSPASPPPRTPPASASGPPPISVFPSPPGAATAPELADPSKLLTDVGNSERLVKRHGNNLRWVFKLGKWHAWDGCRWNPDDASRTVDLCKDTALSIFVEASQTTSEGAQEALSKWAIRSQGRDRLAAMEYLARPRLAVAPERLDSNHWLLNCPNGTVDLRTGELRNHRREDLITRMVSVAYDPAAVCPRWERFLEEVLPDPEVRVFVQRWLGHACTGDVREQYLPIFWGDGNNGKSVLLDTVGEVLGAYATKAPPELLTAQAGGDHPTDIADLMGRRLVVASETEEHARLRVQLMKRLTGDSTLKGRYMRQDFFEFERTHKMVLATNNKPSIHETTGAVWRRIRLVHFGVVIPDNRLDKSLMHKLRAEWAGVLAWLVRGAVDWLREGLTEPAAIMRATREYRNKSDEFGDFAEQCLRVESGAHVASDDLRRAYEAYCKASGYEPLGGRAFGDRLRALGATPDKTPAKRIWVGIKLL